MQFFYVANIRGYLKLVWCLLLDFLGSLTIPQKNLLENLTFQPDQVNSYRYTIPIFMFNLGFEQVGDAGLLLFWDGRWDRLKRVMPSIFPFNGKHDDMLRNFRIFYFQTHMKRRLFASDQEWCSYQSVFTAFERVSLNAWMVFCRISSRFTWWQWLYSSGWTWHIHTWSSNMGGITKKTKYDMNLNIYQQWYQYEHISKEIVMTS